MARTITPQKKKQSAEMRRRTKRAHARQGWLEQHRRRHYANLPEANYPPKLIEMWLTFDREDDEIKRRQVRQYKERAANAATWDDDNDPMGHYHIERYNATMGILGLYQEPFEADYIEDEPESSYDPLWSLDDLRDDAPYRDDPHGFLEDPYAADLGFPSSDELAEWEIELLNSPRAPKPAAVAIKPAPKVRTQLPKHLRDPECEERSRLSYAALRRGC